VIVAPTKIVVTPPKQVSPPPKIVGVKPKSVSPPPKKIITPTKTEDPPAKVIAPMSEYEKFMKEHPSGAVESTKPKIISPPVIKTAPKVN